LRCEGGATFSNEHGTALGFDRAQISGGVFMTHGVSAVGVVRFPGARIAGNLECDGATLCNTGGIALAFDRAEIEGSAFLRTGFSVVGVVRLPNTSIGGNLDCHDAMFSNEGRMAINALHARIAGVLRLQGVAVRGGIELSHASA